MSTPMMPGDLLDAALATGDDGRLRAALVAGSVSAASFARAVGELIVRSDPPVVALEALLDGWADLPEDRAPADGSGVVLSCAAVAAYGEAAVTRPDWFDDEVAKLRRAAGDPRRPVREAVVGALRRMLDADPGRTGTAILDWAGDADPRMAEVAAAAQEGFTP